MNWSFRFLIIGLISFFFVQFSYSQKSPITIEDMANWRYIDEYKLSTTGQYLTYVVTSEAGDPRLTLYHLKSGEYRHFDRSKNPEMAFNEKWMYWTTSPAIDDLDDLRREQTKEEDLPSDTLKVLNLLDGSIHEVPQVSRTIHIDSLSDYLIYELKALPEVNDSSKTTIKKVNKENGFPVVVRNVMSGFEDTLHYITKWHLMENGPFLTAFTTGKDSSDASGILIYDLIHRKLMKVHETKGKLEKVASDIVGEQMVFILDEDTTKTYIRPYEMFHWKKGETTLTKVIHQDDDRLPNQMKLRNTFEPRFTEDGSAVIFGFDDPPLVKDSMWLEKDMIDVEIWSTQDPLLYTIQNKNIEEAKNKTFHAVLNLNNNTIQTLTDKSVDQLLLPKKVNSDFALIYHNQSYLPHIVFEAHDYKDLYGVNLKTGEKWLIEKRVHGNPRFSPSGNLVFWHNPTRAQWQAHDLTSRQSYLWTNDELGEFEDELNDRPRPASAYGGGYFSKDEDEVYLYDRFDIWRLKTKQNLTGKKVTSGRSKKVVHRLVDIDGNEDYVLKQRQLLYLFSEQTKASGYGYLSLDSDLVTEVRMMPMKVDRSPKVSHDAEVMVFTKEDYRTAPDLHLSPTSNWNSSTQVTQLNDQGEEFIWGKIELLRWEDHEGLLVVPEDFNPRKKYPLMVNFYEKSSHNLHRHRRPYLHRSTMNYPHYIGRGYIVFNPDIKYQIGDPGKSALEIVESGVKHLIEKGFVDEDKIALQGHSWGGYQIAHIVTQSDLFACAESGAPVVNMTSAYGGIRWGSGMSRMFQYEQTQSRLGKTLWEDQEVYLRNSPLFNVDKIKIPILILHNDQDQAVPWYQGIEFYMALRRLNKEAWMLNYRGEPHWPVKFENRKDFQTRMMQFFDHYMLGAPMPVWMKEGIPAHLRGLKDGLD